MNAVNVENAIMRERARVREEVVKLPTGKMGKGGEIVLLSQVLKILQP